MIIHNPQPERSRLGDLVNELKIELKMRKDTRRGFRNFMKYAERRLGYRPDYKAPKTFNEKVLWRKIYDRNPLFPVLSDKLRMRDEITRRLGADRANKVLAKVLYCIEKPNEFDLSCLPPSFVAKANHASGWNIFVTPDNPLEPERFVAETSKWLRRSYGKPKLEWAYQPIPRRVMIEEHLAPTPDCPLPDDMKYMCFDGTCQFAVWDDDRFGSYTQHYIARDWTQLHFTSKPLVSRPLPPKPAFFDEMMQVAEDVSQGIDSVRVDFMFTPDRYVLNEFTLYRGSGLEPFDPPEWDQHFGDLWILPTR